MSVLAGGEAPQRYVFVVLLPDEDMAAELTRLLVRLMVNSGLRSTERSIIRPAEWDAHDYLDIDRLSGIIDGGASPDYDSYPRQPKLILLFEHSDKLAELIMQLNVRYESRRWVELLYVKVAGDTPRGMYDGIPNTVAIPADEIQLFATEVFIHFQLTVDSRVRSDLVRYYPNEPGLIAELSRVGPTWDELRYVALVADDPNGAGLIGSWFDSKRQVALTVAVGYLGGAIACFIGDATIIGTTHGIFSNGPEIAALGSLTGLAGSCGAAAVYYLRKVRRIADRSLRVQRILSKYRRQS